MLKSFTRYLLPGFELAAVFVALSLYPSKSQNLQQPQQEHPGYYAQWFERHKNEDGIIPSGLQRMWYAHDRVLKNQFYKNANVIDTVECLGPYNQGGRTRALLVSYTDTNLIYAGAISGGLWRSANGGTTWVQLNDAAVSLAVSCITQSPFNPDEIYYGTGESRANSSGAPGDGIFKSVDHGNTFNQIPVTASMIQFDNIWSIQHSLTDSNTIYAGTHTAGLYRSADKGNTWKRIADTIGAVTDILPFEDGKIMFTRIGNGIYTSPSGDSGTFTKITSTAFPPAFQRVEIAKCDRFPNVLYAAFERTGSQNLKGLAAFCKSRDGGLTWSTVDTPDVDYAFDTYCLLLGVSPVDSNKIICGGSAVVRSTNGGNSWSSTPTVHADHHIYYPLHAQSNNFLIGTDGGMCRKNWNNLGGQVVNLNTGYVTTQYYAGGFAPMGTWNTGGLQDNGSWLINRGSSKKIRGADGGYSHISQQDPNLAYVTQQNGALYRTRNLFDSAKMVNITPSGASGEDKDFINFFQMNYADGTQLYYRTALGIWRTLDSGATWNKMFPLTISNIQTIGCTEEINPTLYIGGRGRFYRVDSAAGALPRTTVNFNNTLPNNDPWGTVTIHPIDPGVLFVGFTSYDNRPRAYKVVGANTNAPQWINISGNLPAMLPVNQIQADPDNPDQNLFAATDFGLYYSVDSGNTWQKESRVPNVVISELKLRKTDHKLFLFTHGRGVWYISLNRTQSTALPKVSSKIDFSVFPNPVTDRITIRGASLSGNVRAEIFTLSGVRVHQVKLSAAGGDATTDLGLLSPGVYLITITNEQGSNTRKFVKL